MAALCSALRVRLGQAARRRSRPAALTLRQKSTCRVCSARPCAATAARVRLVTRAQFSRRSARRRGQLSNRRVRQSSVTWPQPESVRDARLGHLRGKRGDTGPRCSRTRETYPGDGSRESERLGLWPGSPVSAGAGTLSLWEGQLGASDPPWGWEPCAAGTLGAEESPGVMAND